jgi:hypothetical protein
MPRQKTNAPQRLGNEQRQAQNWRMGEPSEAERTAPLFLLDEDDGSYVSEEDLVPLNILNLIPASQLLVHTLDRSKTGQKL